MKDEDRSKEQLVRELAELRQRMAELEASEAERRRVEEALRESEERYRSLIETSPNAVILIDLNANLIMANRQAAVLYGFETVEELLSCGKNALDIIAPGDRQRAMENVQKILETGSIKDIEYTVPRKDGTSFPAELSASLIVDADGEPKAFMAVVRDITKRKRTEEELRRRNRELSLLNQIIAASASGQEPEAILETACRELAMAFDVPQASAALLNQEKTEAKVVARYLAEGRPMSPNEPLLIEDNPPFQRLLTLKAPLVVNAAQSADPLRGSDPLLAPVRALMREQGIASLLLLPLIIEGEVVGRLTLDAIEPRHFSAEDISLAWNVADQVAGVLAQVRLNERRWQLEKQYLQAQKMEAVGQLTAGIAHDFNNLLTAINGFAGLMKFELPPDDPAQELADKILDSGRRAADLVRRLLIFSRKQIIQPQVLDLNTVVAEMDKMLRRIIGEDVELEAVLAPDLWPVKMDPMQIEQVIANLTVNARDAMPTGGRLTIQTANVVLDEDYAARHLEARPGEHVLLTVSDTGVGMSEEVKAHLFEPFFTTKEPGKGTGLGLATVYGIVKQSGGDIWAYSEAGHGTTFKIYLPRAGETVPPMAHRRLMADVPSGDETILLVEDDEGVRAVARRVLQSQGYTVLEARNAHEALSVSAHHPGPIHLLLTDIVMPGMSGKVLAEQLSQARPQLKVLFMSGYANSIITHHGVLDPDAAFLQKPFNPTDLALKVRQVL